MIPLFFLSCKKNGADIIPPPPPVYTPIKLNSSSFTIGNLAKGILDTFQLNFNKRVDVNHIILISNYCLPDLRYSLSNNGTTIKFYNLLCARLGNDYQFEFLVHDQDGKTFKDTVAFSYYSRKLPIEGVIMNYVVTNDNNYCWVVTSAPNQIYCIGLEDTNYIRKYSLNFKPAKIVINPYNQKFYILNYPFYTTDIDKVYIMNPANGIIEKTIAIPHDQYDNPLHHLAVYDLDFGYNGYGVVVTGKVEYGNTRWRILDSRFNDTIYAHPDWISSINGGGLPFSLVYGPKANYNKTKIYMNREYSLGRGAVLDCDNQRMTELNYPSSNPNHYTVPSKKEDKLFVASYLYQGIIGTNSPSYNSQFDNRYSNTADFSYRPNDQNIIYYRGREFSTDYEFMVLDYNNGNVLMRTNVSSEFEKINATTNGRYVLALVGNPGNNNLFVFNTDIFYRYL